MKRERYKKFWKEYIAVSKTRERIWSEWIESDDFQKPEPLLPSYPAFPSELANLTCSARTRAGYPCKQKALYGNGRCKFHGGLSTGPKTPEGKRRSAMNGFKPKKKQTP